MPKSPTPEFDERSITIKGLRAALVALQDEIEVAPDLITSASDRLFEVLEADSHLRGSIALLSDDASVLEQSPTGKTLRIVEQALVDSLQTTRWMMRQRHDRDTLAKGTAEIRTAYEAESNSKASPPGHISELTNDSAEEQAILEEPDYADYEPHVEPDYADYEPHVEPDYEDYEPPLEEPDDEPYEPAIMKEIESEAMSSRLRNEDETGILYDEENLDYVDVDEGNFSEEAANVAFDEQALSEYNEATFDFELESRRLAELSGIVRVSDLVVSAQAASQYKNARSAYVGLTARLARHDSFEKGDAGSYRLKAREHADQQMQHWMPVLENFSEEAKRKSIEDEAQEGQG